jgi:hypothetical protein
VACGGFGNAKTKPAETASHTTASVAAIGVWATVARSRASFPGSAPIGPAEVAAIRNVPITLAYIVKQIGHAVFKTKNEMYAK